MQNTVKEDIKKVYSSFQEKAHLSTLIIDDNRADSHLLVRLLKELSLWRIEYKICETGNEALNLVHKTDWDVIFVDYMLGSETGIDVIRRLKAEGNQAALILLTGVGDERTVVEALREGADDYLTKAELSSNVLNRSLRHVIELKQAENELHKYHEHLEDLVDTRTKKLANTVDQLQWEITERIHVEEELKKHREHLEELVEERSIKLLQAINKLEQEIIERKKVEKSLRKSKKKLGQFAHKLKKTNVELEQVSKAKSDFFAKMSHELRTPLNIILASAQMLDHGFFGDLTDTQKEKHSQILYHGKNLLSLINNVLDISKISAGKIKLEKKTFNLTNHLQEIIKASSSLISNQTTQINQYLTKDIHIYADPLRIKQIIINLLSNAIKFTQKGEINISLQIIPDDKILLNFEDTGIGIDKNQLGNIFKDFYQVSNQENGGTGLGLTIAKDLVEAHDGNIFVQSELKKGSEFSVIFPLK